MMADQGFWDRLATKYAAQPIKDPGAYEKTLARIRYHLSVQDQVLEVGCGTGSTGLLLAGHVAHYVATDISQNMLDFGIKNAQSQGTENIEFRRAAVDDAAIGPGPYSVILALNFLHLVPDIPGTVKTLSTLLAPGGLMISKTVCLGGQAWKYRPPLTLMRWLGKAPYVNIVTPADVRQAMLVNLLEIKETGDFPPKPPCHFIVARKPL